MVIFKLLRSLSRALLGQVFLNLIGLVAMANAQSLGSHVKYYGYYNSSNNISDLSNQSNVAFVYAGNSRKIQEAASQGMKSVAAIGGSLIFSSAVKLDPDYQRIWSNLATAMQLAGIQNIAAIYMYDEPYWNALLNCQRSPGTCRTPGQVYNDLNTLIALIHSTPGFGSIPIAINFAAPSVNWSLAIPPGANWIGFDCYGSITNCYGNSIQGYIDILKRKLIPGQRLFAVPEGVLTARSSSDRPDSVAQAALYTRIQQYTNIISAEPLYIAVFPFAYTGFANTDSTWSFGIQDMGPIRLLYKTIGQLFLGREYRLKPIYRFYMPGWDEHFFTSSFSEGVNAGFGFEGLGFMLFANEVPGTVALYRCYIPGYKHFISRDSNCEGQRIEGAYGYIYSSDFAGTRPLYRWYNPRTGDHFETYDGQSLWSSGYHLEGILGYLP